MTDGVRLVVAGLAGEAADEAATGVAAALSAGGLPVTARVVVEDRTALAWALGGQAGVTVVLTGPGAAWPAVVSEALDHLGLPKRPATTWEGPDGGSVALVEDGAGRAFVLLEAVPGLERLVEQRVVPYARARLAASDGALVRTLRVAGLSAADVERRLEDGAGPAAHEVTISVLPLLGEVWVRLIARGASEAAAARLATAEAEVAARLGPDCYGRDADGLERVVGRLLLERRLTLAVAESCTGGLLGHRLTNVPGSSAYFERGVMVYSNRAKQELLGVPEDVLRAHGAVSAPCAETMARGVRALAGSACALSITGIAGPDGGTPTKPVGTVFVGLAIDDRVTARHFIFPGSRAAVKWQSSQAALDLLRRALL